MGSIIGFNYPAVESVAKLYECWNKDTFDKLRIMESEALNIIRKKNGRRK